MNRDQKKDNLLLNEWQTANIRENKKQCVRTSGHHWSEQINAQVDEMSRMKKYNFTVDRHTYQVDLREKMNGNPKTSKKTQNVHIFLNLWRLLNKSLRRR